MAGSTFGTLFRLTTFGESHGTAIGGVIDGVPANILLDFDKIQNELDRRKPGQSAIVTQRKESDIVQFLSGIFEGKTTGTPIGFIIPNDDQKSNDYEHLKDENYWKARNILVANHSSFKMIPTTPPFEYNQNEEKVMTTIQGLLHRHLIQDLSIVGKIIVLIIWIAAIAAPFMMKMESTMLRQFGF